MKLIVSIILVAVIAWILFERSRKKPEEEYSSEPRVKLDENPIDEHEEPEMKVRSEIVEEAQPELVVLPQVDLQSEPVVIPQIATLLPAWNGSVLSSSGLTACGLASDQNGNIYVSGRSTTGLFVKKFSSSNHEIWSYDNSDLSEATCLTFHGDLLYVMCDAKSDQITTKILVFDLNGTPIKTGDVTGSLFGRVRSDNSKLYVAGKHGHRSGSIAKIGTNTLAVDWMELSNEVDSEFGETGIVSSGEKVIGCGWRKWGDVVGKNTDMTLRTHDGDGVLLWEKQIGEADKDTLGVDVGIDRTSGEILVTGFTISGSISSMFLSKFDRDGTQIWTTGIPIGSMKSSWCLPTQMIVDDQGSSYITGYSKNSVGIQELFVSKYTSTGSRSWTKRMTSSDGYAYGVGIALDSEGNLVILANVNSNFDGLTIQTHGENSFALVKFDPSGNKL